MQPIDVDSSNDNKEVKKAEAVLEESRRKAVEKKAWKERECQEQEKGEKVAVKELEQKKVEVARQMEKGKQKVVEEKEVGSSKRKQVGEGEGGPARKVAKTRKKGRGIPEDFLDSNDDVSVFFFFHLLWTCTNLVSSRIHPCQASCATNV